MRERKSNDRSLWVGSVDNKRTTIAFDTTSHSVYADGLKPFARQGFNKDGDGLDIYKIVSFFSLDSGLPVSFEIQPGNIGYYPHRVG